MEHITFAIKTLGCKVNQYEEQLLRENLIKFGFEERSPAHADIIIVNSCTVTDKADMKTRKLARKLKKENRDAKIFITGCYTVKEKDIRALESIPEIFRVVPGNDKKKLLLTIASMFGIPVSENGIIEEVSGFSGHTRSFLKIQDGCDQSCSYCKVSIVRGPSTSKSAPRVIQELNTLITQGYREIVLTGICLGSWRGKNGETLADLLAEIGNINSCFRIRISSIEPNHILPELITTVANSDKICKHLHIPLQNGSDKILRIMNRKYNTAYFRTMTTKIREQIPLAGLSMDIITGFPGETEDDFQQTFHFVREIKPSRIHVFAYSDREGTASFNLPDKVPDHVTKNRVRKLIALGEALELEFYAKFLSRNIEILVEEITKDGYVYGYSSEYCRVMLSGAKTCVKGEIIAARAMDVDAGNHCLRAEKY
ncbi:MAG: tRNA (N(6)-L-threonylcarbamoyladenosine(37)-C(2))-methylthiotransferase MtaB [Candidatus Omnitrophota bacterium]